MIKKITVFLFAVFVFSCSQGMDGRYSVNIEETRKNIIAGENSSEMEFKISGSNLLMKDPVMGIDIVWSKK